MQVVLRMKAVTGVIKSELKLSRLVNIGWRMLSTESITSVNVHEHKLSQPKRRLQDEAKKKKLQEMREKLQDTTGSLIPETLKQMEEDEVFKETAEKLKKEGQIKMSREERKKRQRALDLYGTPDFLEVWKQKRTEAGETVEKKSKYLRRFQTTMVGLNIGLYCNQACNHCHVESSPKRKEMMSRQVADRCVELVASTPSVTTVDITGGAPELCTEFRYLVSQFRAMDKEVIDRCNLTALLEPGQEDTTEFLAKNQVHIIASLPCYTAQNVTIQRGAGVFNKSIKALLNLNAVGYAQPDSGLVLDLIYNPLGAFLPPSQEELEAKYREELWEHFGVEFNKLYTLTNMPIKRFADFLYRRNELAEYMDLLVRNFNLATMDTLMCRSGVNINWKGGIHDCDFNSQLCLPTPKGKSKDIFKLYEDNVGLSVFDIESFDDPQFSKMPIMTDNHCFACTAGMGSS